MAEAYEIGVRILASGNMAEALGLISSKLTGIHAQTKEIEKSLANWRGLAASAAAAWAGVELFKGLKDIVEHGAKLEHFESQAKAAGYSVADQAAMMGAAWKNAGENINASASESYKNILELAQVTGSVGEAIRTLPAFTKVDTALGSLKSDDVRALAQAPGQSYNFARTLELLGVTQNEAKLDSYVQSVSREIIGMRGLVDGAKLFQSVQNAGGARYGWNEDFVEHVLGPLTQASTRAGAGLYQLDRSFGSGVTTMAMAHGAEKYGFWNKSDEIYDNGRFKGMGTGSIAGYDLLRANPEEWALRVALPLLQSHGVNVDDTNAMAKAINEISRGNKNLNVILDELLLPANRLQLAKERANIDRVPDDAASILQRNDPAAAMSAFTTQWDNLLTALGKPLVADAVATLNRLTEAIQFLAKSAADHPEITRIGGELAAVAAGIAVLAGSVGVLRFALRIGRGAAILADVGAGAAGGAATAGEGAAAGAAAGALGLFVKRLGILGAVIGATEWLDPKGNFGGLTSGVDTWAKAHLGFDPSNVTVPSPWEAPPAGDALPTWSPAWFAIGDRARADLSLIKNGYTPAIFDAEQSREHARGQIMQSPQFARATAPPPIVNTKVLVYVDGKLIPSTSRVVNDSSGFDGRADTPYPDHGFH